MTRARALGLLLGLLLGIALLSIATLGKQTQFEQVGLQGSASRFAVVDGHPVHCGIPKEPDECLQGLAAHPGHSVYLWLGNSQLHAINQARPEDRPASEILHRALRKNHIYLVTYSQPNANLQEHLVLLAYLIPRTEVRTLVLSVVFDDFRETGIRDELRLAFHDGEVLRMLATSEIGRTIVASESKPAKGGDDLAGLANTLQERAERSLTQWLTEHSSVWAARPEARGQIYLALYQLRNWAFRIDPTSTRKMIKGRYQDNWAALEAIVRLARDHGIEVLLYVPPLRDDVPVPYDAAEYQEFKSRLAHAFAGTLGVRVADLEHLVPGRLWGTKDSTSVGGEQELDFMHFKGPAHALLADAIQALLTGEPRGTKPQ